MYIWCCKCEKDVRPRLTSGEEIYPHREDLHSLPFWICNGCGNYVGCHHKTKDRTRPLGCIPTPEILQHRKALHRIIDNLWKHEGFCRKDVYKRISKILGFRYHTGETKSIQECRAAYHAVEQVKIDLRNPPNPH